MDKTNITVLVLGHKGMLGHVVCRFLEEKKIKVLTTNSKWFSKDFINDIINSDADFLINCIGSIPQKKHEEVDFIFNNFLLPIFLSNFFKNKIIHPSSDCEGVCDLDPYARSKTKCFEIIQKKSNTYIIKSSIIGPELSSKKSLWEWFTNNKEKSLPGYTNHFWNGITTLKWAEIAFGIITGEFKKNLVTVSTNKISKFDLLNILNKNLKLNKKIKPCKSNIYTDRCVISDIKIENIEKQIKDLIIWYNK